MWDKIFAVIWLGMAIFFAVNGEVAGTFGSLLMSECCRIRIQISEMKK